MFSLYFIFEKLAFCCFLVNWRNYTLDFVFDPKLGFSDTKRFGIHQNICVTKG